MNVLITGTPGVGKTTLIKKVIQGIQDVHGFYTQEIRKNNKRVGFAIETVDGKKGVLAHTGIESPFRVSKYKVNLSDIDMICVPSLDYDTGIIIIDEIGKMELYSDLFKQKVVKALDTGKVVATIMERAHPFTDEIKKRKDVKIFTVTKENRNELVDVIKKELKFREAGYADKKLLA